MPKASTAGAGNGYEGGGENGSENRVTHRLLIAVLAFFIIAMRAVAL